MGSANTFGDLMSLDVLIPTYNRAELLDKLLDSLLAAPVPAELSVRITVIDNNSSDGTRALVANWQERFGGRLAYVLEKRQGKSHALNTGIELATAELIAVVDDDEEVGPTWYTAIARAFKDDALDFAGGPCLPRWGAACPSWMPSEYRGALGWADGGDRIQVYGQDFEGILNGGNAVIRRDVIRKSGGFTPDLGPVGSCMLTGEDEELYQRLLAAESYGLYLPDLLIYHWVPPDRLRKGYFRRRCLWHGIGQGLIDRRWPQPVPYLGGIPRYLWREALRAIGRLIAAPLRADKDPRASFAAQLKLLDVIGFVYGKHVYRRRALRGTIVRHGLHVLLGRNRRRSP